MSRNNIIRHGSHRGYMHCAEELLRHTSRYYPYAEHFLAQLADQPDFSMAGYDADRLSEGQRQVLVGLLGEAPSRTSGQQIIQIISAVIRGDAGVDEALLAKYHSRFKSGVGRFLLRQKGKGRAVLEKGVSPVAPLQNIAMRLGIPVAVRGREVRVPFRVLVKHLDSPNPTIRRNLQEDILMLHDGGYRLVNSTHRPKKRIDWGHHHNRLLLPLLLRRLFRRWIHLPRGRPHAA